MQPASSNDSTTKKTAWQAMKFTLFSASAGIIEYGSYALLFGIFKLEHNYSHIISLVLSILWNFTFNRRYTFRSDMNVPRAMALVFLFYLGFMPLSIWAGDQLTLAGANGFAIKMGTMLVNFVTEYFYQRFVVYRKSIDTNALAQKKQP